MNSILYRMAWWASMHRWDWLCALIYRYRCPYPISAKHYSPRTCFQLGDCGCDNSRRYCSSPHCNWGGDCPKRKACGRP